MKEKELKKQLMTMGESETSLEQKSRAWGASTIGDAGYIAFTYRTAKSYSKGDAFFCEDLVQEAYLKVGESAKHYRPSGSAHQWRKEVTVHSIIDEYRKRKRREGIVRTIRFTPGSGIEKVLGDDPSFPPD